MKRTRPIFALFPVFSSFFLSATDTRAQTLEDATESPFDLQTSAFDFTSFTNIPGGGWFGQTAVNHDGVDAAQAGPIPHDAGTSLEPLNGIPPQGPAVMTFWWKVSSELNEDFFNFNAPLGQHDSISGEVDWTQKTVVLPCGTDYFLNWFYSKSPAGTAGSDTGWVDEISFTALTNSASLQTATDYNSGDVYSHDWSNVAHAPSQNGSRAVSGAIGDDECSVMLVQINAPTPVSVCFDWEVSSEAGFDFLELWNGEDQLLEISGTVAESRCVELPAGNHCLAFKYAKDGSISEGTDQGMVDNLTVTPLSPNTALKDALDSSTDIYGTAWVSTATPTHDGVDAACAEGVNVGESKSFFTTVSGEGTLSAWWKVSSEEFAGSLAVFVDGFFWEEITGEIDWTELSFFIFGTGDHHVEFRYSRFFDGGGPYGDNRAYVDELTFTPGPPPVQPDLSIKGGKGGYKGDNRYNTSGAGQVGLIKSRARRLGGKYRVRWQNDAKAGIFDIAFFKGTRGNRHFKVKYFELVGGRRNFTAAIIRGDFQTFERPPGAFDDYEVLVKQKAGSTRKRFVGRLTAQSGFDPTKTDAVKMLLKKLR